MHALSKSAAERAANGGSILVYPGAGIMPPASHVNANKGIPGPSIGSGISLCGQCREVFNSVSAFDRHQTMEPNGDVVCWEPGSLGMVRDKTGRWIVAPRLDYPGDAVE